MQLYSQTYAKAGKFNVSCNGNGRQWYKWTSPGTLAPLNVHIKHKIEQPFERIHESALQQCLLHCDLLQGARHKLADRRDREARQNNNETDTIPDNNKDARHLHQRWQRYGESKNENMQYDDKDNDCTAIGHAKRPNHLLSRF